MDLFVNTPITVRTLKNYTQISSYVTILIEYLSPLVTIPVTANCILQALLAELQNTFHDKPTKYICFSIEHSTIFTANRPFFRHLKPRQVEITEPITLFLERILNSGATVALDEPFKFSLFVAFK